jgi:uracil-DNA glycosylase family 4
VSRRRSAYRSLRSLQRDSAACRACAEHGFPIESRPVFSGRPGQRAYILGQAPGILEGQERRPWRGRAGRTLRRWLELDEDEFYDTFYCASVTRCYPGRDPSGHGDRTPTPPEQELCVFWREWELRLLRPELILAVGGLAIRQLIGARSLDAAVGERYPQGNATVFPLPHPSGVSRWLNAPENRARLEVALAAIRDEVARLRGADPGRGESVPAAPG